MSKKRYCINEHDTWVVGRAINRQCKECKKETARKYDEKRIKDPIKRMRKNTMQRIRRFTKGR